jgi:hypothetical protein
MDNQKRLHNLAYRWRELAESPLMEERRKAWTALHDLCPIRPVCFFDTDALPNFIDAGELHCDTDETRSIEANLLRGIKHAEELSDDFMLEPFLPFYFTIESAPEDYGTGLSYKRNPKTHAVITNHPVREPDDIHKLAKRLFTYPKENEKRMERLQQMIGKHLPVIKTQPHWDKPYISKYVFDLVGMDNIYFWAYDNPEAIIKLAEYMADDYLGRFEYMESLGLLSDNVSAVVGAGSFGYTTALRKENPTAMPNLWAAMESQETESLSPDMLEALFLPAMGKVAKRFGLVYYGCCERLHDRMGHVLRHIPRIRAVSVSPWSDVDRMAEALGDTMVFSRKLNPVHVYNGLDWESIKADMEHVLKAVPAGTVEFIYRDVYGIKGDIDQIRICTQKMKALIG